MVASKPGLARGRHLSPAERVAIEHVRLRGASIAMFWNGSVLVDFPLGALERKWHREGRLPFQCGYSIAASYTPDDSVLPMTNADLRYLDAIFRLTRVNVAGTSVTPAAAESFRQSHPSVSVETQDDGE
jgi:hypothetical protein